MSNSEGSDQVGPYDILSREQLKSLFERLETPQLESYNEQYMGAEMFELCSIIKEILDSRAK